ncbi:MAG: SpoIIE family protein phosphatase [Anaerolineae bacterium]|jgi:PAS domain S-box-containing protein
MTSDAKVSDFTDLTPQRQAALVERYARIIELNHHLNSVLELAPLLQLIIDAACELTDTERSSILLVDQETGDLYFEAATVEEKQELQRFLVPMDTSIAGWVVQHNEPLVIRDAQEDERLFKRVDADLGFTTRSLIAVPLSVKGQVIGVLNALNKAEGQSFDEDDANLLAILATQAAVAIENARLYQETLRTKEFNEGLVRSMAEGMVVTDAKGQITLVNPAAASLLGYAPGELMDRRWTTIVPSDHHATVAAAEEGQVYGEADRYEIELVRKDGGRIPVLVSSIPRFDGDAGCFAGTMRVFTDITQLLAHQKAKQELALAWQVQASFLPEDLPDVPGWQLTATLEPARQTSGDFYDVMALPNGRLGILVADVADKGLGAALYMALSRTVIRTYAVEYDTEPELVLTAANRRVLADTRASMFVTVFYGILDPGSGTLTYCNAGHNPPYLLSPHARDTVQALRRTGMALGVLEDESWKQGVAQLALGDTLVLYTDGVIDAEDGRGTFFGTERLLEVARANLRRSAQCVHEAIIAEVRQFTGDAPQFDDITLMVLARNPASSA